MKESNEPTRAPATGVYGLVGYCIPANRTKEPPIHYCEDGITLCKDDHGRHRSLRFAIPHWNPDNPRTCPKCKQILAARALKETCSPGTPDALSKTSISSNPSTS